MHILRIIFITGLVLLTACARRNQEQNKVPPNVLFICVDDLRPELGCYGNELIVSPNLDKLAEQGCLFTNHFVTTPTCGASRYSLLTGSLPRSGVDISNEAIRKQISNEPEGDKPESFIHHLKRSGYYTVGIGKISHYPEGLIYGYRESPSKDLELPHSWNEMLLDPGVWETGWNAFFAYADGSNRNDLKGMVKPYESAEVDDTGYPDGLTANLAISKLQELALKEQPFFLGVGFFKPHLPFNAPKKYWDLYEETDIPVSPSGFLPENINRASLHSSGEFNSYKLGEEKPSLDSPVSDEYARKLRHAYYACVSYIDVQIGMVLGELERLGLEENTVVVVWGDHGWHLGDQLVWGKHTIFDRALRSTLIIKTPGMKNVGLVRDEVVSSIDIYPTLLELCRADPTPRTDGESLGVLLQENDQVQWENRAYSYFRKGISVRTDRYRFTKYFRDEEPVFELYDHISDPYENRNVANENPAILEKLMPVLEKGNTGLFRE